jgi:hypothetical protein
MTDKSNRFEFDVVFEESATQELVYSEISPAIMSVLQGFNVCIFAYGQTGTGKTYTMEGPPENRGVNYRALAELVSQQALLAQDHTVELKVPCTALTFESCTKKLSLLSLLGNPDKHYGNLQ